MGIKKLLMKRFMYIFLGTILMLHKFVQSPIRPSEIGKIRVCLRTAIQLKFKLFAKPIGGKKKLKVS